MKECDSYAINVLKKPSLALMENAANAVKEEFLKIYRGGKIAVVCGGGNNGGDGAAFARLLNDQGIKSDVYFYYNNMSVDCAANAERLKQTDLKLIFNAENIDFSGYDYIIDALFGTGLNKPVGGVYKKVIQSINDSPAFKVAIDMPSGLYGGNDFSAAVMANLTIALAAYKYEQLFGGTDYCGDIIVKDIDIPIETGSDVYEQGDIKKYFEKRKKDSHKGSYGKLCIIAGSGKYFGAALISYNAAASLLAGCGLTCLCVPRFLGSEYRNRITESVLDYLPDNGENALFDADVLNNIIGSYNAICIGMGMGSNEETYKICDYLLKNYDKKLLLDADAINSIAAFDKDIFKKPRKCDVIITPHLAEFSRLCGLSISDIKANPLKAAQCYSKENNITVLLKGSSTVICNGEKTAVNVTGTPAMAKAGSGDVLSGIIGSVMAQGKDTYISGIVGSYIHGKAGELAADRLGEYSVLASDINSNIAQAIKNLQ